ncbi:MAG TPA: phosphomannomutase [Gammaproteobacteria bacterium]|nr:phosphomannomutase [Gammaproteobacteria bacterium]
MHIATLMQKSGVGFGTSGARGRVKDMTAQVCYAYTTAFLQHLETLGQLKPGDQIGIAGDLRDSTPRIMNAVAAAITNKAYQPVNCGKIPSPAIACYGLEQQIPTIMVTGSHIPDDRNGIKFNTASGEILKQDEEGIRQQTVEIPSGLFSQEGLFVETNNHLPKTSSETGQHYRQRFLDFFPANCLADLKIGLYEHSGVGRDILSDLLSALGANVIRLGRSEKFIPVDTEAIREEDIKLAQEWSKKHKLDAIVSTDGDADRPLVSDENGVWLRGDIAGILCANYLGITHIATPVSSNTAVEKSDLFKSVIRTRIGSPYVIAAMQQLNNETGESIAGYEANGGFLQETPVERDGKTLAALPTRDAVIVILSLLAMAKQQGKKISELTNSLPARFTASNRIKEFPTDAAKNCITQLIGNNDALSYQAIEATFGELCGKVENTDLTDGLRITFQNGEIIHLRPSGNAPEFRCYNEADSLSRVKNLNQACMEIISKWRQ